jgi:molecular chaperone DnaJ
MFGENGPVPNIFEHMFGAREQTFTKKRRTVVHSIQITNKEAYYGDTKTLKIMLSKKCMTCIQLCQLCQGQGQINELQRMGPFATMTSRTCNKCSGMGQCIVGRPSCNICKGRGEYQEERKIEVTIPMSVENGKQIVIEGCGEQMQSPNDVAGDLILEIKIIPDPIFERKGLDLIYRQTITFKESILGKTLNVPLYDGLYTFDIAEFGIIEPNKKYEIKGKGMKNGDLILLFQVKYPTSQLTIECKNDFRSLFTKFIL